MLVGFGPFIAGQIWNFIQSGSTEISNGGMIGFAAAELVLLAVVLWIGKIRGWSLATIGFKCSWKGTVAGVFLFVVAEVAMIGVGMLVQLIHPAQPRFGAHQLAVSFVLLLSFSPNAHPTLIWKRKREAEDRQRRKLAFLRRIDDLKNSEPAAAPNAAPPHR